MIDKIWVVEGSTGEYSDHIEWPICFYLTEEKAKKHVEKAAARCREIQLLPEEIKGFHRIILPHPYVKKGKKNEFDPGMQTDYTGTNYRCYPVKIGKL